MSILLFIFKGKAGFKTFVDSVKSAVSISAMIFLTMSAALAFSRFLTFSGLSQALVQTIVSWHLKGVLFVALISFLFVLLGMIMDSTSMLVLSIPLILPVISQLGLNPIYTGVTLIYASQIGIITPPFGLAVFAVKGVAEPDVKMEEIFKGSFPFMILLILGLIILILFPSIITFLVNISFTQ